MVENAIIIALVVLFTHATTWPNQIFEHVDSWLQRRLPEKIHMPVIGCPICMTPWHGLLWITIMNVCDITRFKWTGVLLYDIAWTVITLFVAAGINVVSVMLIKWYEVNIKREEKLELELDSEFEATANEVNELFEHIDDIAQLDLTQRAQVREALFGFFKIDQDETGGERAHG